MTTPAPRKPLREPDLWRAYAKAKQALEALDARTSPSSDKEEAHDQAAHAANDARNALVDRYLPLVRNVAERVAMRVPRGVELEDLITEGVFGLMHAIDSFDPGRGYRFETFGPQRIRGAILDYLRSLDWTPRLARMRQRQVDHATASFFHEHGRAPTDSELIGLLPGKSNEARRVLCDGRLVHMGSLESRQASMNRNDEGRTCLDIADPHAASPVTVSHRRMLQDYIGKELSRSERLIIVLNYYEGLTLAEVGKTLDISESRVSQIRTSILERLRARLDESTATAQF